MIEINAFILLSIIFMKYYVFMVKMAIFCAKSYINIVHVYIRCHIVFPPFARYSDSSLPTNDDS